VAKELYSWSQILAIARFGLIDRSVGVRNRRAQDRATVKPDEVVRTPAARMSGRAASRATNAYAVNAAEIVLTQ
jgi:hypothetical protein